MSDLSEILEELVSKPKSVSTPTATVTSHDPDKAIAVDKHLKSEAGITRPQRGMRITKLVHSSPR